MEEYYEGPGHELFPPPHLALLNHRTDPPPWLLGRRDSAPVPLAKFLRSRLVFYPGAGGDTHPIEIFGKSGAAHCFIFVDYLIDRESSESSLESSISRLGYSPVHKQSIPVGSLWPDRWERHFFPNENEQDTLERHTAPPYEPFAWFGIWAGCQDPSKRIATLYIGYEAHEVYDRLFCQPGREKAPFGILLQDHGLGGLWTSFASACGHLAGMTLASGLPKFLLAGEPGFLWNGYRPASTTTCGGMHHLPRRLHRRIHWPRVRTAQEI
jgi:hypothetical protein